MIVGNGDIANVLKDKAGFCFFASGVSKSQGVSESEYARERDLLLNQNRQKHLVYFSSLGVLDGNSRYYQHKKEMEELVKNFRHYTIVRLGNITWGDNPHTLINSMRGMVERGLKLEIQDVYRYIVDKDEFLYWVNLIPSWSCEMNIPGRRMKVKDIVKEFV